MSEEQGDRRAAGATGAVELQRIFTNWPASCRKSIFLDIALQPLAGHWFIVW